MLTQASPLTGIEGGWLGVRVGVNLLPPLHMRASPVLEARARSTQAREKAITVWADVALSQVARAMVQVLEAARRQECRLALRVNVNLGVPGGCWSSCSLS